MTVPAANVSETESARPSLAAAGLSRGDFPVAADGNVPGISKSEKKDASGEGHSRQEHNYSSFSRSFTLPEALTASATDATYKHGIPELMIPASASGTTTRVNVK